MRPQNLQKRIDRIEAATRPERTDAWPKLLGAMFGVQRRFVEDASPYETAVCSRRGGKTVGCAGKLLGAALKKAGSVSLYLTLSRLNAKRIVWPTLLELNRTYKLGGQENETELYIRFPNRSVIYLAGVKDKTEIEKFRGLPLAQVVIDEAQSLPGYIEELVDAVLAPALMDFSGSMALIGTPAPVPTGYFHKCATSPEWSHHAWTVFDNPHIERKSGKPAREHLLAELKRRGITEEDPVVQREWFGRWVLDRNSLVFAYDAARNDYKKLPESKSESEWEHIIGVDLGFDDADAIAVLAWSENHQSVWLVDEWTGNKQTVTQLGDRLKAFEQQYKPMAIVADTGGLGKKIAEEISRRTEVPIEAAEKERKLEHIELLNDALRTGRFHAKRDGRFAQDSMLVEWDRTNPEKPKISDRFHSDICDAVLYAYRRALHWTYEEPKEEPTEVDEMFEAALERANAARPETEGVGDSSYWEEWARR